MGSGRKLGTLVLLIAAMTLVTGCAIKATGGGWLTSVDGSGKANFSFTFDGPQGHLQGVYHDLGADPKVRLKLTGLLDYALFPGLADSCMQVMATYESQDRRDNPGSGVLEMAACGPSEDPAWFLIVVNSGPYEGYVNSGEPQGGQITPHEAAQ